jgi:hypothetical protein
MKIIILVSIIFLTILSCTNKQAINVTKNNDEISDYYRNSIETGKIKPLTLLETIDKEKYGIVINYLPENEKIEDYYFSINFLVKLDENRQKYITPDDYYGIKDSTIYRADEIEYIEYAIWYYEAFLNKYNGYHGDPTGKCFSIHFNGEDKFIGRIYWR